MNEIDKCVARLIMKIREKREATNNRCTEGFITTDSTDFKRIIRDCILKFITNMTT